MKRLIGILIIAQAFFVGIICYQIKLLSDSVFQAASFVKTNEGTLGWGGNLPTISLILLGLLALFGLYLTLSKQEKLK